MKDLGDKVSADEKQKAEQAKEELKKALEGNDIEAIKEKKTTLEQQVQQLSVKLYEQTAQQQQQQQQQGEAGNSANNDDDVVDADFEEVDDDQDNSKQK